jgi:hypothetical protein
MKEPLMSRHPRLSAIRPPRRPAGIVLLLFAVLVGAAGNAAVGQQPPADDAEQQAKRLQQQAEASGRQAEAIQRQEEEARQEAQRQKRARELFAVQEALARHMAEDGVPGPALHGILAGLHHAMVDRNEYFDYSPDYPSAVRRLLGAKWLVQGERANRDDLAELADGAADKSDRLKSFRRVVADYGKLTGEPSPFDWTRRRDFWLDYTATALRAMRSDRPAEIWTARVQDDAQHAELYRFSYVETLRQLGDRADGVEFTLIDPLVDAKTVPADERFRRLLLVVSALEQTGDAARRYHELLLASLKEDRLSGLLTVARDVFFELPDGLSEAKRLDVIRVLLDRRATQHAGVMARYMNIPPEQTTRWFLGRPLSQQFQEKVTLAIALEYLLDHVYLPAWLEVPDELNENLVNLDTQGIWIDVLERTVKQAGLRAAVLDEGIVWVGPAGREAEARRRLRAMRARAADLPRLQELVAAEMMFPDTPASDALEFITDAQNVRLFAPGRIEKPVNMLMETGPAYFALGVVAEQAALRWDVAEDTVIVAPQDEFEKWEEVIAGHRRRMIRVAPLQLEGNQVALALGKPTTIELNARPLQEAADFLAELHTIPVEIVTPSKRDVKFTRRLFRTPLAWTLTLLLAEHDLTWGTDGRRVVIGSPEDVAKVISR